MAGEAATWKTLPAFAEMSEDWMEYERGKRSSLFKVIQGNRAEQQEKWCYELYKRELQV